MFDVVSTCHNKYLITLIMNIDFYIAFRKMSNMQDYVFELLDTQVNSLEMFWLQHAIAFCKSMDDSSKMQEFTTYTLTGLYRKIVDYVEESHLLLIKYLAQKHNTLDINEQAGIIASCIAYLFEIWIREATSIYTWICVRHAVSKNILDEALDLTMADFDNSRCYEPYLKEFDSIWNCFGKASDRMKGSNRNIPCPCKSGEKYKKCCGK